MILPLWLQDFLGYTPLWAGIAVMPVGILPVFLSFYVSRAMQKYDLRVLITFSFLVFGVTSYLFSLLYTQISASYILHIRFWQGLGLAFFFLPIHPALSSQNQKRGLCQRFWVIPLCPDPGCLRHRHLPLYHLLFQAHTALPC